MRAQHKILKGPLGPWLGTVCALLAVASPAAGDAYRCDTPQGVVNSQWPCDDPRVQQGVKQIGAARQRQLQTGEAVVPDAVTSRSSSPSPHAETLKTWEAIRQLDAIHETKKSKATAPYIVGDELPRRLAREPKELCQERHIGNRALQEACLRKSRRGSEELKGDYGMRPQDETKAKDLCRKRHPDDFAIQAACMRNQARGYAEMGR